MISRPNADQNDVYRAPNPTSAARWILGGHRFERGEGRGIFYRRDGSSGETMVLLHGFLTWSSDYVALVSNLAADHDVIAPDFLVSVPRTPSTRFTGLGTRFATRLTPEAEGRDRA